MSQLKGLGDALAAAVGIKEPTEAPLVMGAEVGGKGSWCEIDAKGAAVTEPRATDSLVRFKGSGDDIKYESGVAEARRTDPQETGPVRGVDAAGEAVNTGVDAATGTELTGDISGTAIGLECIAAQLMIGVEACGDGIG